MNNFLTPEDAQAVGNTLRAMALSIENLTKNRDCALVVGGGDDTVVHSSVLKEANAPQLTIEGIVEEESHTMSSSASASGSSFFRSYVSRGGGVNFALYGVLSGLFLKKYVSTLLMSIVAGVCTLIGANLLGYATVEWRELIHDGHQRINRFFRWTRHRPSVNNGRQSDESPPEIMKIILSKPFMAGFFGSLFL